MKLGELWVQDRWPERARGLPDVQSTFCQTADPVCVLSRTQEDTLACNNIFVMQVHVRPSY